MSKYRRVNNLLGWVVFLISAVVYLLTIEPTVSLWDCGEFISTAYKLQIGHPPGAPLFMIVARFFSLFASDTSKVAMMVNAFSGLASAFTIMFLFWTITHLALKLVNYRNASEGNPDQFSLKDQIIIFGSGLVGSLAYTFSDTFWFSAVEGEVYASSSLFTALVFWAVLKWENEANQKYANRWLILIAYLMGLSIGVHLLNLLAIPAIVMVYYFKKYDVTASGVIKALLISVVILGIMMYGLIPGLVWLASRFELIFVNGFGMPYNSGVLIYFILLLGGISYGIWKSHLNNRALLNSALLMLMMVIIGYSSFATIVIRSMANPPMDENNPDNIFSLQYYLNREQYGDRPLIYGQYFNAQPEGIKEGKPTYTPLDGKYKITNRKLSYQYDKRFTGLFPRMWSSDNEHVDVYIEWAGLKESHLYEPRRDADGNTIRDNSGKIVYDRNNPKDPPGFAANMKFFFTYQLGQMYFRYFMWNFVGRQNDTQGFGDPLNGNWISGVKPVDDVLIGKQDKLPGDFKNAPSRNTYYFLPLLLGLFGLIFQLQRDSRNFWVVMLLFILTGIAIVIYLNQTPSQPRERDYAYAGSFYAFAIWIGLGVLALYESLSVKLRKSGMAILISILCLGLVPGIMANQNWDDHDRSGRYTTRDIAADYLNSCAPNAILFTNGDNDTFPLWYAQEVEGIRTDVRVVNLMLLNMDWHIDQIRRKAYESEPLPVSLKPDQYINGTRDVVFVQDRLNKPAELKDIMSFVGSDLPAAKVETSSGNKFNFIPTKKFILPVDTSVVLKNGTVAPEDRSLIVPSVEWTYSRGTMGKSSLIVMDILANNNWERPIYFASLGHEGTLGLENYMQLEGFAYRLVPIYTPAINRYEAGRVESNILYKNLMEKFSYGRMNEPDVYLDDFHVRTISVIRLRTRFLQLANALINKRDTARAVQVLDRCMELTPHIKVPFDYNIIQVASAYYKCGQNEKANQLVEKLAALSIEKLDYYLDQELKFIAAANDEVLYNFQILQNLINVTKTYKLDALAKKYEASADSLYNIYTSKTSQASK
ncbi:MAG TPA: DUF2723 domain-containing protein [Bacteroidales bacterium]|nr:DUF2723 domain-containing protein [Bacteroidales bacterium]